jgi:phosphoribosylformylglycinamidine synthase
MSGRPVIGIVVFPGSNCDYDCAWAFGAVLGADTRYIWHKDANPDPCDAIVLPGGFSYGDYLRCGAIARFSPVMQAIHDHAAQGRPLIGICNGFQILCEAGLLPGALYRNQSLNFICEHVYICAEQLDSPFTCCCERGRALNIPIAHGEGQYYAEDNTLDRLEDEGRVAFRYCSADGEIAEAANPNGSRRNIAGIFNETRTILGMMPHPERAANAQLGSEDGVPILKSLAATLGL